MLKATVRKFKTTALIAVCLSLVASFPNVQRSNATANNDHVTAGLSELAAYKPMAQQNGGCPPLGFDQNAPNLLRNPSFEDVGPRGASASIFVRNGAVDTRSAAADWTMHTSNNSAQVITEVIKSNRLAGASMLHITAGSNEGGVYQLFDRDNERG